MKKIPEWLKTTLSVLLLALIFVAYLVTHNPVKRQESVSKKQESVSSLAFNHALTIGKKQLFVAFAALPPEQERGLSDTASLADDQGMLFLFPTETKPSFWMKDMNYALDIVWIDGNKKVIEITPNLDPKTYPKSFTSKSPAQFILEVPAGFAEKNDIVVGTQVSF